MKIKTKISRVSNAVIQMLLHKIRNLGRKMGAPVPESLEAACLPEEGRVCIIDYDNSWYTKTDEAVSDGLFSLKSKRLEEKIEVISRNLKRLKDVKWYPQTSLERCAVEALMGADVNSAVLGEIILTLFNVWTTLSGWDSSSHSMIIRHLRRRRISKIAQSIGEFHITLYVFTLEDGEFERVRIRNYEMTIRFQSNGVPYATMGPNRQIGDQFALMVTEMEMESTDTSDIEDVIQRVHELSLIAEKQRHEAIVRTKEREDNGDNAR